MSRWCRSTAEGIGLPKLVSLAIRGRCRFAEGDRYSGDVAERWLRLDRGDIGKGMVTGMGGGDADGVAAEGEWICGDSGLLDQC